MRHLPHNSLFDISQYAYAELFKDQIPLWEVLAKMKEILKKIKQGSIKGDVDSRAYLINPEQIIIGENSIVEAGAYIKGPCIIGSGCEVRSGAYVRGNVITGDRCVIGHSTELKNTLFLNDVKASHFAYIGDSIVGNRVNFGAGVKCANVRLDKKNIVLFIEGEKIDTQLKKLGAIIGDDVQLGCNSVLNPGTIMGKKSGAYPCLTLQGVIPDNVIVKEKDFSVV